MWNVSTREKERIVEAYLEKKRKGATPAELHAFVVEHDARTDAIYYWAKKFHGKDALQFGRCMPGVTKGGILELLKNGERRTAVELATLLKLNQSTVRGRIRSLRLEGKIKGVRGGRCGIVLYSLPDTPEIVYVPTEEAKEKATVVRLKARARQRKRDGIELSPSHLKGAETLRQKRITRDAVTERFQAQKDAEILAAEEAEAAAAAKKVTTPRRVSEYGPQHVLAIDPSLRGTGYAYFYKGRLSRVGLVRSKLERAEACVEIYRALATTFLRPMDCLLIEIPQVYSGRMQQKGDPNDLISVALVAGACFQLPSTRKHGVLPHTWKGNVPKEVTARRVVEKLSSAELGILQATSAPESLKHNIFDAIGLGQWWIEKSCAV